MDTKYYQIGYRKFKLERTSSGYYEVIVVDGRFRFENIFATRELALVEILSYAQISEEDMEENERM